MRGFKMTQQGGVRRAFAVLLVCVVGGLASVTAAQAGNTTITSVSVPISDTIGVPCANGGAGELVDVSGRLQYVVRVTLNGDRFSFSGQTSYQDVKGIGETTGDTYVVTGGARGTFNGSFTNAESTVTEHINLIGQGAAPNVIVTIVSHFTVNENGDLTVLFDKFNGDCG